MTNANLAFLEKVAQTMNKRGSTEKQAGMQDVLLWLAKNRGAVTAGGAGLGASLGAMNAEEGQRMGGALKGGLVGGGLGFGAGYGARAGLRKQLQGRLNAVTGTTPAAARADVAATEAARKGTLWDAAPAAAPAAASMAATRAPAAASMAASEAAMLGQELPAIYSNPVPRGMGRGTPVRRGFFRRPPVQGGLMTQFGAALTSKPAFLEGVEMYFAKTAGAKEAFAARVGLYPESVGEELWKAALELQKRAGDGFDPESEQARIDAAVAAERKRFQAEQAARIESINRRAKTQAYGGGIPDQKAQAQLIEARNALARAKASGNAARVIEAQNTLAAAERQVPNTPSARGGLAQEGPQAIAAEARQIQQEMKQRPAQEAEKAWQAADAKGSHRPEGQRPFDPMNYLRQKWAPVGEDLQKLPQDIREKGWLGGLGGFAQEHPYATGVGALGAGGLAYAVHRMLSQRQPKPKPKRRTA